MASEENDGRGTSVPRPDPTVLTTQALEKQIGALKELVFTRMDSMEKALDSLLAKADRRPSVCELEARIDGRLKAIELRFDERDLRFEASFLANKSSVEAAFVALKEAVKEQNIASSTAIAKAENATTKEIDSLKTLISLESKSMDDKHGDFRSRLTTIESTSTSQGRIFSLILTGLGLIIAVAAVYLGRG
jgi:hypothetical protein